MSDMVLMCSGGTPTTIGQPIPQGTIAVILDTPITSRLLASGWSEALLLVDEPSPATQVVCGNSTGVCNLQGNGTGLRRPTTATSDERSVYQANLPQPTK